MTPAEERELLELAAKARGLEYEVVGDFLGYLWDLKRGCRWTSLHDSGDCFDLAAHLCFSTYHMSDRHTGIRLVEVHDPFVNCIPVVEKFNFEKQRLAATRLAVTRAAAEIGRRMKG